MDLHEHIPQYKLENLQHFFGQMTSRNDYFYIDASEKIFFDHLPFRTETYGLGFLQKGSLQLQTGLEKTVLHGPCILAMGPSVIRSFEPTSPPPTLKVIFFTESFFTENLADVFFLSRFKYFDNNERHVFDLNTKQEQHFRSLFEQMEQLIYRKHMHETMMIRGYLLILIHELDEIFNQLAARNPPQRTKQLQLMGAFKLLLARDFKREHAVDYYAERLHVTPKYLSGYLKKHTGKTAGQWINQTLILEAKILLLQKQLSVAEVSNELNFSDQSVFGKFFKVNTGTTPLSFKKNATS